MYLPLRQQQGRAKSEERRAGREEQRADREEQRAQVAEERAKREEQRAQRAEDKANRARAASFLREVASALDCIERELRERRLPPHKCGHKFDALLDNYLEENLQPYLGAEVQKHLRELKNLSSKAHHIDAKIYDRLQQMGLTESEASNYAFEEHPKVANDPVKESWLIESQRVVGELEAAAAGLEGKT